MKTPTGLALAALASLAGFASLATVSAASADTVIIHRDGGYHRHRPFFHPHPRFHRDRTVIIRR